MAQISKKKSTPKNKKLFGAKIDTELIKKFKHLSVDLNRGLSLLLEESIRDTLKKYSKK
jgi:hypothetical protein